MGPELIHQLFQSTLTDGFMKYLKNDRLPLIRSDWEGNPYQDGQFRYPDKPFYPSWRKLLKWQLSTNPHKEEKKQDEWRPPRQQRKEDLFTEGDFIAWLGHASFYLQLGKYRLITDPVLYDLPFIPRFVPLPYEVEEMPPLDFILLSHDHRDHCDKKSIQSLFRHHQLRKVLTALKMQDVIGSWINGTPVEEAAWYQVYDLPGGLEVTFLPARHWCRRGLFDFNRRLWGSFLIRTPKQTIYFGADSGYAGHFREIGERFPGIDIAILGIGAYRPAYMMEEIHTSPADATRAFRDLGARYLLPMHYGTYDLSDEPISEPYRMIQQIFEEEDMKDRLLLAEVGEVIRLPVRKNIPKL